MDLIKKYKNYIIWAGCILIAVSCFLTFIKVSGGGQSSTIKFNELTDHGNEFKVITAYVVLAAAVVSAALVFIKKAKYSLISTGIAFIVTFYDYSKVSGNSIVKLYKTFGGKVSYVAPWIILVGVVLAVVPIVLDWKEEN